jgi:hypothetical protein
MDELYIAINTDLIAYDLCEVLWDELFMNHFHLAGIFSERGDFIAGNLADDTKLDGRGKLPLPGEIFQSDISFLENPIDKGMARQRLMDYLENDYDQQGGESRQISFIGSLPSLFRFRAQDIWYPRFAPAFDFTPERSSFEITFFDASWITESEEIESLCEQLKNIIDRIGTRRKSLVEFEVDGAFRIHENSWRHHFSLLPLANFTV